MNRPLPIIRLPPDRESRAAFWRYMYARGFSWAEWTLEYALACLDQYDTWPTVHLIEQGGRSMRYSRNTASDIMTLVNSPSHFISYTKRLNS